MDKVSYVGNADVNAIEHLYQQYRQDPTSVDLGWAKFFEGFEFAQTNYDQDGSIPENFVKEFKVINSSVEDIRQRHSQLCCIRALAHSPVAFVASQRKLHQPRKSSSIRNFRILSLNFSETGTSGRRK